jgi:hypothetical protein
LVENGSNRSWTGVETFLCREGTEVDSLRNFVEYGSKRSWVGVETFLGGGGTGLEGVRSLIEGGPEFSRYGVEVLFCVAGVQKIGVALSPRVGESGRGTLRGESLPFNRDFEFSSYGSRLE